MSHRFVLSGAVAVSTLALAAPALAKPAPFQPHSSHSRSGQAAVAHEARPHAAATVTTAPGPTLYVNGSTGNDQGGSNTCRLSSKPCKTIGQAVAEAPTDSASRINVSAGTYPEQLTITKNVTIKGAALSGGQPTTIIQPTSVTNNDIDTDSSQPQYAIVDFAPGVEAGKLTNIKVDGSAAQSSITGCGQDYVGVYYHDASGTLTSDRVTNIENPAPLFGCQGGQGIYVATDSGDASNVTMNPVTVDNYDKNGITCDDVGTVCTISKATVTGLGPIPNNSNPQENVAQNGIQLFDSAGSVTTSTVSGNSYTSPDYCPNTGACNSGTPSSTYYAASGILVGDAGDVTLTSNRVTGNDENVYEGWDPSGFGDSGAPATQGTWTDKGDSVSNATNNSGTFNSAEQVPFGYGLGDGLDLDGASGATVQQIAAYGDPDYGIGVFATTGSTIGGAVENHVGKANSGGTTYEDGEGIYVGDPTNDAVNQGVTSSDNTVSNNIVGYNQLDGILADDLTAGNTFSANRLSQNGRYDAEDLSSGGGTGNTANTWSGNHCAPAADSHPTALCTS